MTTLPTTPKEIAAESKYRAALVKLAAVGWATDSIGKADSSACVNGGDTAIELGTDCAWSVALSTLEMIADDPSQIEIDEKSVIL